MMKRAVPSPPARLALLLAALSFACASSGARLAEAPVVGRYLSVHDLRMYYVDLGAGRPLLLLHGGTATVATSFGTQLPIFSRRHRVIAPEQIGHGHTGDAGRAFSYPQMADDTAELLRLLGIAQTDVLGISDGGIVGMYLAARHPALVRRLVVLGAAFADRDLARTVKWADGVTDASWPADDSYTKNNPDGAAHWPIFRGKILAMYKTWTGLRPDEIAAIRAPTMIVIGDRDVVTLEQAGQMKKALPGSRLCVLPDTRHLQLHTRGAWLNPMVDDFLDQGDALAGARP